MASIVSASGVPHTPQFPMLINEGGPVGRHVDHCFAQVAEAIEATDPDVIVLVTSDHFVNFFETVPLLSVGVADGAAGPVDYLELPQCELVIAAEFGRHLQRHAIGAGFDVGVSQELVLDHPITIPVQQLRPALDLPIVPFFVNGLAPPLPLSARCYALGEALRRAIEDFPEDLRVAMVASGSFSLEIGGPRMSKEAHVGVPDPEWMERVTEHLMRGTVDELVTSATVEQLGRAGNAGGELLNWLTVLGTVPRRSPAFLEAQPDMGHAFGSWQFDGGPW